MQFLFCNKNMQELKLFEVYQEPIPQSKYGPSHRNWRKAIKRWNLKELERKSELLEKEGWERA